MQFLDEVETSFAKRQKFWRYQLAKLNLTKKFDQDCSLAKIEIEVRSSPTVSRSMLQIHIWEDRWIWIEAREISKLGLAWNWTCEGRPIPSLLGRPLIANFEKSFEEMQFAGPDINIKLNHLWAGKLALGPQRSPAYD